MKIETTPLIADAANRIAGAIFEDCTEDGPLSERLEAVLSWRNLGTDCDLTIEDRTAVRLLLDAATGVTSDLVDYDTGDVVRAATVEEVCESAIAPGGVIRIDDDRQVFAQI